MKGLALGAASLLPVSAAFAKPGGRKQELGHITENDAAILRFLAAAEILETDLWQQYTEVADLDSPYVDAFKPSTPPARSRPLRTPPPSISR